MLLSNRLKRGKRMAKTYDLTSGSIPQHLLRLAAPLIMGNILQQLYNTVDAFILGRFAGEMEFAAVGIAGAVSHNVGQVLAAMLVLQTNRLVYYMGVLVLVGIATGAATGTLASLLMKHIPPAIAAKVKRERKEK